MSPIIVHRFLSRKIQRDGRVSVRSLVITCVYLYRLRHPRHLSVLESSRRHDSGRSFHHVSSIFSRSIFVAAGLLRRARLITCLRGLPRSVLSLSFQMLIRLFSHLLTLTFPPNATHLSAYSLVTAGSVTQYSVFSAIL